MDQTSLNVPVEEIPSTEIWEGIYEFKILPFSDDSNVATYSDVVGRLCLSFNTDCLFTFQISGGEGLYLRVLPVYECHDSLTTPVKRCRLHTLPKDPTNDGFPHQYNYHFIRIANKEAEYLEDRNKRLSVRVPVTSPNISCWIKAMCFHSCVGGPNRRVIVLLFYLEDVHFRCYGRQVMPIRSCSCPLRDRKLLEKVKLNKENRLNITQEVTNNQREASQLNLPGNERLKMDESSDSGEGSSFETFVTPANISKTVEEVSANLELKKFMMKNHPSVYREFKAHRERVLKPLKSE